MKFSELDLHPSLLMSLEKLTFSDCTPIQEATIPHIMEGRDLAGLAQTGTGKTAAFLLPLMERIVWAQTPESQVSEDHRQLREKRMFPDWRPRQFVLVLVPTRELAEQVHENAEKLKGETGLRAVSIYGGVSYEKQKQGLRDGVEFVIATPGRLLDLYKEHLVDLKQVRAIVFDEADRMFDMGFKDDMKFILQRVPKERQFLVFSATLNLDVLNTAYQFGANPVEVNVSRDQAKAENVDDRVYHVGQEEKGAHLLSLLRLYSPRQAIVFSNFKMNVPRITQFLNDNGLPAVGISSLLTQSQRNRVMDQFKGESDRNILVATDVAARGLDIKGVDMVVNYELPDDPENYVHRIGRTGRAGAKGIAGSFVSDRDLDALTRIESYLRHKVQIGFLEEGELIKDFKTMRSERGMTAPRGPRTSGGGGRPPGSSSQHRAGHTNRDFDRAAAGAGGRRGGRRGGGRRPSERGSDTRTQHPRGGDAGQSSGQTSDAFSGVTPRGGPDRGASGGSGMGRGSSSRRSGVGPQTASSGRPAERGQPSRHHRRGVGGRRSHGGGGAGASPSGQQGIRSGASRGHGRRHQASSDRSQQRRQEGSASPSRASIGQKVSGFFKRLFR